MPRQRGLGSGSGRPGGHKSELVDAEAQEEDRKEASASPVSPTRRRPAIVVCGLSLLGFVCIDFDPRVGVQDKTNEVKVPFLRVHSWAPDSESRTAAKFSRYAGESFSACFTWLLCRSFSSRTAIACTYESWRVLSSITIYTCTYIYIYTYMHTYTLIALSQEDVTTLTKPNTKTGSYRAAFNIVGQPKRSWIPT